MLLCKAALPLAPLAAVLQPLQLCPYCSPVDAVLLKLSFARQGEKYGKKYAKSDITLYWG